MSTPPTLATIEELAGNVFPNVDGIDKDGEFTGFRREVFTWAAKPLTVRRLKEQKTYFDIVWPRAWRKLQNSPWPNGVADLLDDCLGVTTLTDLVMEFVADYKSCLYDVKSMKEFKKADKSFLKRGDIICDQSAN